MKTQILTIKQLSEACKHLKGERCKAVEAGAKFGLNPGKVDVLRCILGYSKDKPENITQEVIDKAIQIFKDHPEESVYKLWQMYGKKLGIADYQKYYAILRKNGIDSNRKRCFWTKFKDLKLLDARDNKHMTFKEIAQLFNNEKDKNTLQLRYQKLKKSGQYELRKVMA